MEIPIMTILLICLAVAGIIWAYPKIPFPFNLVVVGIVVLVCLLILVNMSGVANLTFR